MCAQRRSRNVRCRAITATDLIKYNLHVATTLRVRSTCCLTRAFLTRRVQYSCNFCPSAITISVINVGRLIDLPQATCRRRLDAVNGHLSGERLLYHVNGVRRAIRANITNGGRVIRTGAQRRFLQLLVLCGRHSRYNRDAARRSTVPLRGCLVETRGDQCSVNSCVSFLRLDGMVRPRLVLRSCNGVKTRLVGGHARPVAYVGQRMGRHVNALVIITRLVSQ